MSRALLLYGLFILVALGLLYWRLSSLDLRPRTLDEIRRMDDRVPPKEAPRPRPFPYDESGRIAAFRLYPKAPATAGQPRQPLFWLKGTRKLILDDDWTDGLCRYQSTTMSEADLDDLLHSLLELPELSSSSYLLEQRDEESTAQTKPVDLLALGKIIELAIADRVMTEFRPQALRLRATQDEGKNAPTKWPLLRTRLKELLESETTDITRAADIDKLMPYTASSVVFEQADLKAQVTIEVLTDRP